MKNKASIKSRKKVLVWAVDPFDAETKPTSPVVSRLAHWAQELGMQIQPVFVLSVPMDTFERGTLSIVDEAQTALEKFVAEYRISGMTVSPEVILDESNSRLGAVHSLIAHTKKVGGDSIALSSHGRAGLKRFVFGSFAENLLRESPAPIIFLSKEVPPAKSPTALFPTDFSLSSRSAFKKLLSFARPTGMEVVLFHAISLPAPVFESMATAVPSAYVPENYFAGEESRARRKGSAWIKQAAAAGVSARLVLNDRGIGLLTGDVILDAADRAKASLIALATESKPIEHLLFGSAALAVFRAGRFPVWICGPKTSPRSSSARPGRLTKKSAPSRKRSSPPSRKRPAGSPRYREV